MNGDRMEWSMKEEEYCIKWKGFQGNMLESLEDLKEDFADVSISCEGGGSLQAHKLILASCSPYFLKIFKENPCPHPVLILNEVPYEILRSLMTYMYRGSVSVSEKSVPLFLKAARILQIKGIALEEKEEEATNNLSILATAAAAQAQNAAESAVSRRKTAPPRRLQEYRVPKYSPPASRTQELIMDLKPVYEPSSGLGRENDENLMVKGGEENKNSANLSHNPTLIPKLSVPHQMTTLLTIPDPNIFINQEGRHQESQNLTKVVSALDASAKIPSPPPEEVSTQVLNEDPSVKKKTNPDVLMPLTSSTTSEQMAALLGPSWKSRQPRMCPYCKRMFSNKFNLKQHILNMHTVGRELQCEQCQKKVKNKWYLRRHHVTHHGAPLKK